jgi:hypothetical protein
MNPDNYGYHYDPRSIEGYRARRRNRLDRLQQLKKLNAPPLIILNEKLLLLHARICYWRPEKLKEYVEYKERKMMLHDFMHHNDHLPYGRMQ